MDSQAPSSLVEAPIQQNTRELTSGEVGVQTEHDKNKENGHFLCFNYYFEFVLFLDLLQIVLIFIKLMQTRNVEVQHTC